MAIGVEPYISNGLPRKELYDSDPITYKYKHVMAAVLKRAYRSQWRAHNYNDLAEQVFKLERRILNIAPPLQAWQRGKVYYLLPSLYLDQNPLTFGKGNYCPDASRPFIGVSPGAYDWGGYS